MLFQNPDNQIISPIVEEDVAFGPINLGLSKQEVKERTDWALKVLGIEKLREHSPYMQGLTGIPCITILCSPCSKTPMEPACSCHIRPSIIACCRGEGIGFHSIFTNGTQSLHAFALRLS